MVILLNEKRISLPDGDYVFINPPALAIKNMLVKSRFNEIRFMYFVPTKKLIIWDGVIDMLHAEMLDYLTDELPEIDNYGMIADQSQIHPRDCLVGYISVNREEKTAPAPAYEMHSTYGRIPYLLRKMFQYATDNRGLKHIVDNFNEKFIERNI